MSRRHETTERDAETVNVEAWVGSKVEWARSHRLIEKYRGCRARTESLRQRSCQVADIMMRCYDASWALGVGFKPLPSTEKDYTLYRPLLV